MYTGKGPSQQAAKVLSKYQGIFPKLRDGIILGKQPRWACGPAGYGVTAARRLLPHILVSVMMRGTLTKIGVTATWINWVGRQHLR
jgi:hypothetical protein